MEGRESSSGSARWLERARKRIVPLCDSCVKDVEVDGGGVALLSSDRVRAVVYTSDDVSTALEALQIDLAEGPCIDAGIGRSPVLISDLRDPGEGVVERWPFLLREVDPLGIRGVFAFPLRVGSIVLGTLELYRSTAGPLQRDQLSTALRAADDMGSAIVDLGQPMDVGNIGRSAASVHQAAGMVMVQLDSTIDEAMALLRASAFAEGVSLLQLSADVLSGRRRFTKEQT